MGNYPVVREDAAQMCALQVSARAWRRCAWRVLASMGFVLARYRSMLALDAEHQRRAPTVILL